MLSDKLKNFTNRNVGTILAFVLGALIFGAPLVRSWTEPTCAPPGCNTDTPLNVGEDGQSKLGSLLLNAGGYPDGLHVASGLSKFGGLLTFTNASAAFRRITNLGAPIDSSDAATKSYVDAQVGGGSSYRCFLGVNKFTGNLGGKSGADAKCAGEEGGFSFGTSDQWYSRATGAAPVNAFVYGGANTCSSWNSTSGNGDVIAWDKTNARWGGSTAACSSSNSLVCCNFNASGVAGPSSLAGTPVSEIKSDLSWVDNSANEQGFKVYRGSTAGFTSPDSGFPITIAANSTAYRSDQPAVSLKYYKVTAYNAGGESNASNEVSVTTPAGLIAPTNLAWTSETRSCCYNGSDYYSGKFTWSDNSDLETNYQLMYCETGLYAGYPTLSECRDGTSKYKQVPGVTCSANRTFINGIGLISQGDGIKRYYRIKASTPGAPATDGWSNSLPTPGIEYGWIFNFNGCQ